MKIDDDLKFQASMDILKVNEALYGDTAFVSCILFLSEVSVRNGLEKEDLISFINDAYDHVIQKSKEGISADEMQ